MKLYTNAKLVAVSREEFKDKESGDAVVYFVNVLKVDGSILNANSKADYSDCEGKEGVAAVEVSVKQGKRDGEYAALKYSLKNFIVGDSIETEDEIR